MSKSTRDRRVIWRRLGTVLAIALPLFFFLPGIGFDTSHPASLARQNLPTKTWFYAVKKGDVLSKIAERELGTLHRYKEILALNPGVKPRALPTGGYLKMPPKDELVGATGGASTVAAATAQSPRRLLMAFAALLALVVLVVAVASRLETRAEA